MKHDLYEKTMRRLGRMGIKHPTDQIVALAEEIEYYRKKIRDLETYLRKPILNIGGNLERLLQLMTDNPDLPVVPMVDSEVVGGEYGARWMGSWGRATLDRYFRGEERLYFYDENDMEEVLEEAFGCDWMEDATDAAALAMYRTLPWVDCIVVNIDLPE